MMVVPWYNHDEVQLDHNMTIIVEPWYQGRFCHGTPILVNLEKASEVDKWYSKSGSEINICLFPSCPIVNKFTNATHFDFLQFLEIAEQHGIDVVYSQNGFSQHQT